MGTYVPNTEAQKRSMLSAIGVGAVEELFAAVPRDMLVDSLRIPEGLSELSVRQKVSAMAAKNRVYPGHRLHPLSGGDQPGYFAVHF